MHDLYALKEKLIEDLSQYGRKKDLSGAGLEIVDKLAHAAKNVCKVIEMCSEEQESSYRGSYDGGSYRDSYGMSGYSRNGSYARGRMNAPRDGMGRYSGANEEMVQTLHELMEKAPNDKVRQSIQKLTDQIEQM